MNDYYRETIRNDITDVPTDVFYEIEDKKVLKVVEIDRDASFFWNDISCYKPGDEYDDYRLKRGSLKEYDFMFDDKFVCISLTESDVFWQRIEKHEFYGWYKLAKKIGKRRYEVGIGNFIVDE